MWENIEIDRHYHGTFKILDKEITGELIYNKKNGYIILNLIKETKFSIENSYDIIPIIIGRLNNGYTVTLFNNKCIRNKNNLVFTQLNFTSEYMITSNKESIEYKYNKMVCILKNAYEWSSFSVFEETSSCIKVKNNIQKKVYNWFGAKISFSPFIENQLLSIPIKEETKIIQRLMLEIEINTEDKDNLKNFILIRNKILALISFAIKDNVNIEEQYLYKYNDSHKNYLYISEPTLDILNTPSYKYNFSLKDLPEEKDINIILEKLEPIFNLYLSLFKYKNMPYEMVFLNIIQALETFHSRFFYKDDKNKYIKSVEERFKDNERYKKLLLSDAQMNKNCDYIILISRLYDLLIGKNNGLFYDYYGENKSFAQTIVDTRHYYTHYNPKKEAKALKGDDLLDAIHILTMLLEYHICLVLGFDNSDSIRNKLVTLNNWKQLNKINKEKSINIII